MVAAPQRAPMMKTTTNNRYRKYGRRKPCGMILFVVAMVIAMVAVGALALYSLVSTEYEATVLRGDEIQAAQLVQSGIEYIACLIDSPTPEMRPTEILSPMQSEMPDLVTPFADSFANVPVGSAKKSSRQLENLYDNPTRFRGVPVAAASLARSVRGTGRFSIFSPRIEQDRLLGVRFGLVNESTRLHLGAVLQWELESPGQGSRALLKLPGMTPAMADSILDWVDADKTVRPSGAEFEYYERAGVAYRPRNAVPTTLEELLLVRDVTRALLFGKDESFSYGAKMGDLQRRDAEAAVQSDLLLHNNENRDDYSAEHSAEPSLPWCFLLTTLSAEKLLDPEGNAKIFLNDDNLEFLEEQLKTHLDDESVQFLMAWRNTNGKIDDPIDLLDATIRPEHDEKQNKKKDEQKSESEELRSPFSFGNPDSEVKFLKLLDYGTTSSNVVITGRININEASRTVLEAVPELNEEVVEKIIATNTAQNPERFRHAVWLLSEKIVDKETMKKLSKRLTTGGDVYRAQIVGFFDGQGTVSRAEVVVDATVKPPRQIFSKDLTMFGSGFE